MNNIEILEDYKKLMEDLYRFMDDDMGGHFERVVGNQKANTMIGYLVFERQLENLIKENTELKEYKKISELTKVSCCTAQNCEALNKAIKNGLENVKLLQENKELKDKIMKLNNQNLGTQSYNEFFNK